MSNTGAILGVILAGGMSRRMDGTEKSLLKLGGTSMIARVAEVLAPQVGQIIINANGDPARFNHLKLPVVADPKGDTIEDFAGPLAGVLAGLEWAKSNRPETKFIVTVAADTPFFPADLTTTLLESANNETAAICLAKSASGRHPVFGLWDIELAPDLRQFLEQQASRKVMLFVEQHRWTSVEFTTAPSGHDPFFNINTPDDLAEAHRILTISTGGPNQ